MLILVVIPILYEGVHYSTPGCCRPLAKGDYRGFLILCKLISNRYKFVSFTIQELISVDSGYETLDMQIEGDRITAIAPQLPISGIGVDG